MTSEEVRGNNLISRFSLPTISDPCPPLAKVSLQEREQSGEDEWRKVDASIRVDVSIADTSAPHLSLLLLVMGPCLGLGKYYERNCVFPKKR